MKAFSILLSTGFLVAMPNIAQAANKTWVSGTGVDSGTCTFAAPCATFDYAISQANVGGEVDVKDTGAYGTFTIGKSISIEAADGVLATINVPVDGTGVLVNTGPSDTVAIRGLTINGHGLPNTTGIFINNADNITISHCYIRNSTFGVNAKPFNMPGLIINNQITGNGTGFQAQNPTRLVLGGNYITGNGIGFTGLAYTYGDNEIVENSADFQNDNFYTVGKH